MKTLLPLLLILIGTAAQAAVTVEDRVLQQGYFKPAQCKPVDVADHYDACLCEADIHYPELSGMRRADAQMQINEMFKKQALRAKCEGDATTAPADADKDSEKAHDSVTYHYEITYQSPTVMAFNFAYWTYTGGAHGNGSAEGVILDLETGLEINANDLFKSETMPAVNKAIYDYLSAKPEEEIFREQIEARKDTFISGGDCQGCTLVLMPGALKVVFQTYEVAPYASGNTEVPIPANLISNAAVSKAIQEAPSAVVPTTTTTTTTTAPTPESH